MELTQGITAHCWNGDRTQIALGLIDGTVEIYDFQTKQLIQRLQDHFMQVSSIDWHPETNMILTVSHDRNTIVWTSENQWKPNLVTFIQKRGILDGKWSFDGQKIALATGRSMIGIGHYSQTIKGWKVQKIQANRKSSITTICFDQSGLVVLIGDTQGTIKMFTCYIQDVDQGKTFQGAYADTRTLGDQILEVNVGNWVNNAVIFSNEIAVAIHEGGIQIVRDGQTQLVPWIGRPFAKLQYLNENTIIAVGWDNVPVLFSRNGGQWQSRNLDSDYTQQSAKSSAFQQLQKQFEKKKEVVQTTKHKNNISSIFAISSTSFSTGDIQGALHIWTI